MRKLLAIARLFVVLPIGCVISLAIAAAVHGLQKADAASVAVLFWCVTGGVIGAVINGRKGHGAFIGFAGGAIFGPIFVWLFLLDKSRRHRKCPYCAEQIRREATVCRYCHREVLPPAADEVQGQGRLVELRRELAGVTPYVFVTWALIGLNVLVFVLMSGSGVSPFRPTIPDLLRWGADFGPKTIGGEWWRLLTCTFIHIGIVHLVINMLVLAVVGPLVERMVGNAGFLVLYVLAGLIGSLVSLFWNPVVAAAGASGAIFGVYGALLAQLLRRFGSLRTRGLARLWLSGSGFLALNLLAGLTVPTVDFAAHVGGLAGGIVFGIGLSRPFTVESPARRRGRIVRAGGLGILLVLAGMVGVYLWHPNLVKVYRELDALEAMEKRALDANNDAVVRAGRQELSDWAYADLLEHDVIPDWRAARNRLSAIKPIPAAYREQVVLVLEYMHLRQDAWELFVEALREGDQQKVEESQAKHGLADAAARRLADRAGL
jgi:membrane associated rhomboid family serine protease